MNADNPSFNIRSLRNGRIRIYTDHGLSNFLSALAGIGVMVAIGAIGYWPGDNTELQWKVILASGGAIVVGIIGMLSTTTYYMIDPKRGTITDKTRILGIILTGSSTGVRACGIQTETKTEDRKPFTPSGFRSYPVLILTDGDMIPIGGDYEPEDKKRVLRDMKRLAERCGWELINASGEHHISVSDGPSGKPGKIRLKSRGSVFEDASIKGWILYIGLALLMFLIIMIIS